MITAALIIIATFTMQATAGQSIASNTYNFDNRRSGNTFATKKPTLYKMMTCKTSRINHEYHDLIRILNTNPRKSAHKMI